VQVVFASVVIANPLSAMKPVFNSKESPEVTFNVAMVALELSNTSTVPLAEPEITIPCTRMVSPLNIDAAVCPAATRVYLDAALTKIIMHQSFRGILER